MPIKNSDKWKKKMKDLSNKPSPNKVMFKKHKRKPRSLKERPKNLKESSNKWAGTATSKKMS
jgi:hypothetical protein